ncbi:DUF1682-domain-containing protein [Backusella circina FSU 941]|nr:DUF1682-domain-containing protein [Backusella circina FSU 941]
MMVRPFTLQDFQMEIVLLTGFLVYTLVWYQGKRNNLSKAKNWLEGQIDYINSQFALVGDKTTNEKSVLMMDGPSDYLLYTSGRRNVQFGHWWFKLKPRNDVLTLFTTKILSTFTSTTPPAADRVVLTLTLDKEINEQFVFGVVKKELADDLYKKRFDLKNTGKIASSKVIPENFTIYAEAQKLADAILTTKVGEIISQNADRLESLVISSLPAVEPEMFESDGAITISLSFLLPNDNQSDRFVELACELPDIVAQLRLAADVKSKVRKNREELTKEFSKKVAAERAEELQKKKADAKRAEEERVKKLSPAEQRKYEEKERVRQMKKQQKKRKM